MVRHYLVPNIVQKILSDTSVENARFIIQLIKNNLAENGGKFVDKSRLETSITRWDTFNLYKTNDADNPVFKKAVSLYTNESGVLDIDKAGRYIVNSEIVNNYPMSSDFVKNKEVLELIMTRNAMDKGEAVKYLCKFDEYNDLTQYEKTRVSRFADVFNLKDNTEKASFKIYFGKPLFDGKYYCYAKT